MIKFPETEVFAFRDIGGNYANNGRLSELFVKMKLLTHKKQTSPRGGNKRWVIKLTPKGRKVRKLLIKIDEATHEN